MGGPSPFVNAFKGPSLNSLRYNTSQAGSPIPIVYGTQRVSVNLIEVWGFSGKGGKGGKGGITGSGKKSATYSANVAFGVCQGPVSVTGAPIGAGGYNRVFSNGGIAHSNQVGLNYFAGNDGQSPDPNWVGNPADPNTPVIGYSGTFYVTGDPMQLGQSPVLPNISFEVTGLQANTAGPLHPGDANPASIITDFLTNSRYGAGFPSANLDTGASIADFANYCQAAQIAMSYVLDRQQPAARWLDEIAKMAVAAIVWSGGLLKVIPYSTGAYAANSATWSAALTPQYALTDNDLILWGGSSDPVVLTRSDPEAAPNWLSIEYQETQNNYNPQIVPVFDQGAIDAYGLRTMPSIQGHCFTNGISAFISGQLQLNRAQSVRTTFKFQLGWRHSRLEPMDIVTLTDANAGLTAFPVRITAVVENDNGELQIEAEELENVLGSQPPLYNLEIGAGAPLDLYADPGNANAPIVFDPPAGLTNGAAELWLLSSGGASWGGANIWVSTDGSTYALVGTIYAGSRQGLLNGSLANYAGANPDNTHTLHVDLTQSAAQLASGSAGDAANNVTLCYVDGELISYQTAVLTSAAHYDVTVLYRGAFGTAVSAHSSGTKFAYLGLQNDSPGLLKYPYPSSLVGQTISIKLQSFNRFGNAAQDISTLTPVSYVLTGAGISPLDNPVIAALAAGTSMDWGLTGAPVIATADFGGTGSPVGIDIDYGAAS